MMTFKGITSDAMSVTVLEYPPVIKPEMQYRRVKIPGRHGEVTLADTPSYDPYVLECKCKVNDISDATAAKAWLTGRGDLILGNDPSYAYEAQVIGEVRFEKIMRGYDRRRFTVSFLCQPLKKAVSTEANIELTTSGNVNNIGSVESRPLILVEGSGDVVLMIGTQQLEITGISTSIRIDVELGMAFDAAYTENLSHQVSGDWPTLAVGTNAVSWTGTVTKVTITPRWRYL